MGIPGNEAADAAAKEAASSTDMSPQPVSLSSALCCINRTILDPPIKHERTAAVYEKINLLRDPRFGVVIAACSKSNNI